LGHIPERRRDFSLLCRNQNVCADHTASKPTSTGVSSRERSSCAVNLHVVQTLSMVGLLFLNLYLFLICCFIKHRYFPTFLFLCRSKSHIRVNSQCRRCSGLKRTLYSFKSWTREQCFTLWLQMECDKLETALLFMLFSLHILRAELHPRMAGRYF